MFKKIASMFLAASIMVSTVAPADVAWAQQPGGPTAEEKAELTGTRRQLATIIFAGLSGAILGLSTLSFYGRPQDHLSNIAVGFALGVITGAIFTTYKAATKPYETYDISQESPFGDKAEMFLQNNLRAEYAARGPDGQAQAALGWRWEF